MQIPSGFCFVLVMTNYLAFSKLNILIHSAEGSRSHIKPILEISEELLRRNHQITYVAMEDKLLFAQGYNVNKYSLGKTQLPKLNLRSHFQSILNPHQQTSHSGVMLQVLQGLFLASYDEIYFSLEKYLLKSKPDVVICDFAASACSDLAQKYAIPLIIGLQTTDVFNLIPSEYITRTMSYAPLTTESLSFLDRIYYQILEPINAMKFMYPLKKLMDHKKTKFGINPKPTIMGDFNYGLGLANTYIGFEPAQSIPSNIKLIGPILSQSSEKLDKDFQQFLDHHSRTIYIGFGTNVVLSTNEIGMLLQAVVTALQQNIINGVIWGLTNTLKEDFPDFINIDNEVIEIESIFRDIRFQFRSWVPQPQILQHSHLILHVTHGGLESIMESLITRTPMLVIPFLGDQPRNAAKVQMMKVGDYVNRLTTTSLSLVDLIKYWTNTTNQQIQSDLKRIQLITRLGSRRIIQAADIIEEHAYLAKLCRPYQPYQASSHQPPCELAHLIPASTRMSWWRSINLDIYLTILLLATFLVWGLIRIIQFTFFNLFTFNMKPRCKSD